MNKITSIIIIGALVIGIGIVVLGGHTKGVSKNATGVQNSEIRDGIQYVTIEVKAGYSPKVSTAKAGIPTKLIVKTNGTYDCSASLVIKSLNYQKILSQTGEEIIDIGTPVAGTPLRGVCGMGMYNFLVNFS
jgi:plastocyanin domain-containing protein